MNIKKAFTMAEAILVMVILGIIATIMISNMKPVEFRDKGLQVLAKKILGQIDTATTQILFNNAQDSKMNALYVPGTTTTFSFGNNTTAVNTLYAKYLVKTRKTTTNAWCKKGSPVMVLKDGSCIGFKSGSTATKTWIPGETGETSAATYNGLIYLDVNDNDEPNIWGKDQYTLPINDYGIAY